jgi:hypothetical protein
MMNRKETIVDEEDEESYYDDEYESEYASESQDKNPFKQNIASSTKKKDRSKGSKLSR